MYKSIYTYIYIDIYKYKFDPSVALFDTNPLLYSVALPTYSCHNSYPSIQMAYVAIPAI